MPKILTGRAVTPIMVRPRTSAERACLEIAAKAAGVSLSHYLLESALAVAAEEGHTPAPGPERWRPRRLGERTPGGG